MTELFEHPYASFLARVARPNRYTGAEYNVVRKDWSSVGAKVCLAFPDIYDIGMSHLGYRILYKLLNDDPRIVAERCYTPWIDMQEQLLARGLLLASLESVRPLCDFDVVGFSLQYELTYTNVLSMLQLGGIPLRSAARGDEDPLILAGGPVATHAEPLAPFVDAFLIGDGEEAAREIALCWVDARREGLARKERLLRLAQIRGVYVPSLYDVAPDPESGLLVVQRPQRADVPFPVERRLVDDLNRFPFPDDAPVGGPEAIFDRMSIEVARGCTEGCRFCQAGMIYRPVRERDPEQVVDTVLRALEKSGQDEVSLTALSTADVSCISPLIKRLVEKTAPERVSLSVASLRAYGLAEDLLDDMRKVRATGLTFAPEAGTQRMRDVINKNVTEEQLLETAERVFSRGFDKMKLYFILGLPTEADEDVLGIAEVGKSALAVGKRVGKRPQVTISVSTHVPKPHTPFQWCAMDRLEEVQRKQALLRGAVRGGRGLNLRVHSSTTSVLEGVLARGDRRLADALERAFLRGARFDSWEDQVRIDLWEEAFEHFGIDTEPFLGTLPLTARLPWDHIDVGLEEGFLAREYQKALKGRLSPPCGKAKGMFVHHTNVTDAQADSRKLVCYDCGIACDLGRMRSDRVQHLTQMGALQPGERARLPVIEETPARIHAQGPERYRPPRAGGPAQRWRLRYTKVGPLALLGHLDLIRELPRVVRRAGVRTKYTEGFRPKPDMSFGPALALGLASLDEYLDIELLDAPPPEELVRRLNEASAPGLEFLGAAPLGPQDPGLSKIVSSAVYVVGLSSTTLERLGGRSGVEQRVRQFLDRSEAWVRRDVKGVGRKVDVRAGVTALWLGDEAEREELRRAGIVGRLTPLKVVLPLGSGGTVRLGEVIEALFGAADVPHVGVRVALRAGETSPLDLVAHRRPPRLPGPAVAEISP